MTQVRAREDVDGGDALRRRVRQGPLQGHEAGESLPPGGGGA